MHPQAKYQLRNTDTQLLRSWDTSQSCPASSASSPPSMAAFTSVNAFFVGSKHLAAVQLTQTIAIQFRGSQNPSLALGWQEMLFHFI